MITKAGGAAVFVKTDVSKVCVRAPCPSGVAMRCECVCSCVCVCVCVCGQAADCKAMVDTAVSKYGGLHAMFNNAGIMDNNVRRRTRWGRAAAHALGLACAQDDNAETTEEAVWDKTFNVNVKGVFLGCKYGIPAMRKSGGGSIINTASFVAVLGAATPQLAYTSSKGAVLSMSRELAVIHARCAAARRGGVPVCVCGGRGHDGSRACGRDAQGEDPRQCALPVSTQRARARRCRGRGTDAVRGAGGRCAPSSS